MKRVYVYQNCFAQDRFSRKVKNDRKCYKKLSQTRFLVFSKILRYGYFNQEKERNWGKCFFRSLFICIRYRVNVEVSKGWIQETTRTKVWSINGKSRNCLKKFLCDNIWSENFLFDHRTWFPRKTLVAWLCLNMPK